MVSWLIIIGGLILSWYFTDSRFADSLHAQAMPIVFGVFLIALFIKLVLSLGTKGGGDGFFSGMGDGGSDSGGGGCGGD